MSAPVRLVIEATKGWAPINVRELWDYRELAYALAKREVLVRYKQSILGAAWAVLQPLLTVIVFTVLFTVLLGRQNLPTTPGVPYAVSTFCALLPWQIFSQSVLRAGQSVVTNQSLITKVYFPRLLIPLAPVLAALVDFSVAFGVLLAFMAWFDVAPGPAVMWLPVFVLFAIAAALAVSIWFAALNAMYRDVQHVLPFVVQILMYVSPVLYSASVVLNGRPDWMHVVYGLNPMAGVAEGFRWSLLGSPAPPALTLVSSACAVVVLLIAGGFYFRRMERTFADVV